MDSLLKFLWKLFLGMLFLFLIAQGVQWYFSIHDYWSEAHMIVSAVVILGTLMIFPLMLVVPLILLLVVVRFIHRQGENAAYHKMLESSPPVSEKVKSQPLGRYQQIDSLLDGLNDSERIYAQSRLGSSELVVSDDGELVTVDEYRKQNAAK